MADVDPGRQSLRRRSVLAALLGAGAGWTAGCARIPTDGPVRTEAGAQAFDPGPREIPALPRPGASPADIVSGFLRASSVDFREARAYLAGPDVGWKPETGVLLHRDAEISVTSGPGSRDEVPRVTRTAVPTSSPTRRSTSRPTRGSTSAPTRGSTSGPPSEPGVTTAAPPPAGASAEVVVTTQAVASLDPQGRLTLLEAVEKRARRFRLVVRRGQWRIADLDDGVVMSLVQFVASTYLGLRVYFPDATGDWLVPDVRYIRRGLDSTPTQVVSALLAGPSTWLAGALTSSPIRPQLTVSSVPVIGGVATVDLTAAATSLDQQRLAVLFRQLQESLDAVPEPVITSVELTVGGQRLRTAGAPGGLPSGPAVGPPTGGAAGTGSGALPMLAARAGAGTTYVAVDGKARIVLVTGGQPRLVDKLALTGGARPAMSYDVAQPTFGLLVPGRTGRSLRIAAAGEPVVEVVAGPDFTAPSFDSAGWVWTCPRRPAGGVVAGRVAATGRARRIDVRAPWLTAGEVVSLRISREGARAVLLVDTVDAGRRRASRLALTGVERRTDGEPVALGQPVRLLPDLVRASDVGWLDDTHAVVLGTRRVGDAVTGVQPWIVDIGGDPSTNGISSTAPLASIVRDAAGHPVTTAAQWERLGLDVAPSLAVGDGEAAIFVGTDRGDLFHYRQTGSWEGIRTGLVRPAFPG